MSNVLCRPLSLLLLIMGVCTTPFLFARTEQQSKFCCDFGHKEKKQKTCAPTPLSHATTITKSGCYCLTRDIGGTIVIAHDDVILDLNCHRINANSASNALMIDGYSNITIQNGALSGSTSAGILVNNAQDITLLNLIIENHAVFGVQMTQCQGLILDQLTFNFNNVALLCDTCVNGLVSNSLVSNNESSLQRTIYNRPWSAVVLTEFCNNLQFLNVNVCNNANNMLNKTSEANAIFTVVGCSNIDIATCAINNNTLLTNAESTEVAYIANTDNFTVFDTQINDNICTFSSILYGQINILSIAGSTNGSIEKTQVNNNSAISPDSTKGIEFVAIELLGEPNDYLLSGDNMLLYDVQCNNNSVVNGTLNDALFGIACADLPHYQISRCQVNDNSASGACFGILALNATNGSHSAISESQANGNSAQGITAGIFVLQGGQSACGIEITDCQTNDNASTGTASSIGLPAIGAGIFIGGATDALVSRSQANNNSSLSSLAGGIIALNIFAPVSNITVTDSVMNGNNSTNSSAAGLLLSGIQNIVVLNCESFDTVSSSTTSSNTVAGIDVRSASDVLIQNSQVYNTNGTNSTFAYGISILDSTRCIIESSQISNITSSGNYGQGIVLWGSTNTSKVQDCSVMGCTNDGFVDYFEQNTWFGNTAEANSPNFTGVKNTPVVYSKGSGMFSSTPNRWSNITIVPF